MDSIRCCEHLSQTFELLCGAHKWSANSPFLETSFSTESFSLPVLGLPAPVIFRHLADSHTASIGQ